MSIYPKIVKKGETNRVTLHMQVTNYTTKKIYGTIKFEIKRPDRIMESIEKPAILPPKASIDRYFKYDIKGKPIGKYIVDGKFCWDGKSVKSITQKNDFFIVKEAKKMKKNGKVKNAKITCRICG